MLCLLDLNHDVLLHIFKYLDVASVLRSTRVSSACKSLAQSKHVWLALVFDLGSRHLLDLPPRDALLRFSTTQLIEEVKRAVFGPRTWAANSPSAPTVRRHIHVSTGLFPPSEPTLLSGDKHLLVQRRNGCEIWDIAEGRRIWVRDGILRSQVVAQLVHDGTELLIVLCTGQTPLMTMDPALMNFKLIIHTFLLDLKTDSERPMLPVQLPRACPDFSEPIITDDIWAADVQWGAQNGDCCNGVLLVNWRETTFVLLHLSGRLLHKKLLRGHLLAVTRTDANFDVVLYYPLASLNLHWKALDSAAFARAASHPPIRRIEPIIVQRLEYPILPGFRPPLMSVHESPLHHGSYVVSTHTASIRSLDADGEETRLPALHRYRLTLPTAVVKSSSTLAPAPAWERISGAGTINCVLIDSLTYAGYGLSFPSRARRTTPRFVCCPATGEGSVDGSWTVPLPAQHHDCVCLSPDTGALTICSAGGADVYYYE
ncbi:hypothetical protein B0H11DRAFT_2269141 [Mycena galericulata]|nr:hypothetical protein B0H11DRAFT_2269141 [Mycena galericulata]